MGKKKRYRKEKDNTCRNMETLNVKKQDRDEMRDP